MLKVTCRLLPGLLMLSLLWACGDSVEVKSRKMLEQAKVQVEQGQTLEAEQTLAGLLASYPDGPLADEARRELDRLKTRRESAEREAVAKLLGSYHQVLAGYKSMYGHYPRSEQDLDQSEYFFDTDYLAELATEEFQVYLWFAEDGSTFKVWCLKQGQPQGYLVDHRDVKPRPLARAELLAQVEGDYRPLQQKGGLAFLAPKG